MAAICTLVYWRKLLVHLSPKTLCGQVHGLLSPLRALTHNALLATETKTYSAPAGGVWAALARSASRESNVKHQNCYKQRCRCPTHAPALPKASLSPPPPPPLFPVDFGKYSGTPTEFGICRGRRLVRRISLREASYCYQATSSVPQRPTRVLTFRRHSCVALK